MVILLILILCTFFIFVISSLIGGGVWWWYKDKNNTPPSQNNTPPSQNNTPPSQNNTPPSQNNTPLSPPTNFGQDYTGAFVLKDGKKWYVCTSQFTTPGGNSTWTQAGFLDPDTQQCYLPVPGESDGTHSKGNPHLFTIPFYSDLTTWVQGGASYNNYSKYYLTYTRGTGLETDKRFDQLSCFGYDSNGIPLFGYGKHLNTETKWCMVIDNETKIPRRINLPDSNNIYFLLNK